MRLAHVLHGLGAPGTEDIKLKQAGLNQRMPSGWIFGLDPLARNAAAGIALSPVRLKVKGAIKR